MEAGAKSRVIALNFAGGEGPLEILCLGAHSDDIEIGAGATLLTLSDRYDSVSIHWVVLSAPEVRQAEARRGAELFAPDADIRLHDFPDSRFPMHLDPLKDAFVQLAGDIHPDVIFTHAAHDRHQDHEVVNRLTWQTFRDHLILEYEIPKFDGDLQTPNLYVEIESDIANAKIRHLATAFRSQTSKPWFEDETFLGLMRIRGIECRARSGYAEGFHMRKATIS